MRNKGFTFITGILLLTAILMITLLAVSTLTVNTGDALTDSLVFHELKAWNDGCVDEGLIRLRNDSTFIGATLQEAPKTCTITVSPGSNNVFTITVNTNNTEDQKVNSTLVITRTPVSTGANITITSYNYF